MHAHDANVKQDWINEINAILLAQADKYRGIFHENRTRVKHVNSFDITY